MSDQQMFFTVIGVLVVIIVVLLVLMRKAKNHPDSFRRNFETPFDAGVQALIDAKWTPAQVDGFLQMVKEKDLTAKAAGLYQGLPPEIVEAANKISTWSKSQNPQ